MTVILSKKASKKNAVPNRIQVQVRVRNIPTWRPGKSAKSRSYHSNLSKLAHDSPLRDQLCLDVLSNNSVKVSYPDESRKRADKLFCYDRVYSPLDSQEEFYNGAASGLIEKCLEGYNGCIFAYGQTASGKSYTMHGLLDAPATNEYPKERGLIHRAVEQITKHIHSYSTGKKRVENLIGDKMRMEFSVKASFLEIYQEQLKDLLCEDGAQGVSFDLLVCQSPCILIHLALS